MAHRKEVQVRVPETYYKAGEYLGQPVFVSEAGMFFTFVDPARKDTIAAHAKTKAALQKALRETDQVSVRALLPHRWHADSKWAPVEVYSVSAGGQIMYRDGHGAAQRLGKYGSTLFAADPERERQRRLLLVEKERIEEQLRKLVDNWPRVTAETIARAAQARP